MVTLILADIDGVFAPIGPAATGSIQIQGVPYGVEWNLPLHLVEALTHWVKNPSICFKWVSSWEEESALITRHLQLPEQSWVKLTDPTGAKVQDIRKTVLSYPPGTKVFVLDDEITQKQGEELFEGLEHYQVQVVTPNPTLGLSPATVDLINQAGVSVGSV